LAENAIINWIIFIETYSLPPAISQKAGKKSRRSGFNEPNYPNNKKAAGIPAAFL
jgi:hypothetical protein